MNTFLPTIDRNNQEVMFAVDNILAIYKLTNTSQYFIADKSCFKLTTKSGSNYYIYFDNPDLSVVEMMRTHTIGI